MNTKSNKLISIFLIIMMLVISINKVYARNTDYPDKEDRNDKNKNKGVGVAVIEQENVKDVNSYFYLYYDDQGEVHITQYIENPMQSEKKKKWILKTDADNLKAKELGAKEYYQEEDEIKKDEKKEATKLYKEIVKATGKAEGPYDYLEGSIEDEEPYSIKNIIINKVQIFDVNFFSEKPGGKEVVEDSIVGIVRRLVATWYVSFRNLALIILAVLIIYYGIRLAISTVSAEQAQYKTYIVSWLKSLLTIVMMHYIMYIILYANETFINTIMTSDKNESSIYNTIKTRALEAPFKIAVPAVVMYLVLIFIWVKYIIAYFKRMFTVAFLIILAPLVGIRYAIDSGKGRGSGMVSSWIQRFATSVFIQSIHALVYSIFIESAVDIALVDFNGFFIALFLLHFMLSTDKIFIKIFSFEFEPGVMEQIRKPFNPAQDLIELKAGLILAKDAFGLAKNAGTGAGKTVLRTLDRGYTGVMDALDDKFGGDHKRDLEDRINSIKDSIDDGLMFSETDKDGNPKELGNIRKDINNRLKLRKLSRQRGKEGIEAKKKLKLKKGLRKRKFASEFKFVRDITLGMGGIIFAIPVAVTSEQSSTGITLMVQGISTLTSTSRDERRRTRRQIKRANAEIDNAINSINANNSNLDRVEKQLDKIQKRTQTKTQEKVTKPETKKDTKAYAHDIKSIIRKVMENRSITSLKDNELEKLISMMVDKMKIDLTDDEKKEIKKATLKTILDNRNAEEAAKDTTPIERDEEIIDDGSKGGKDDTDEQDDEDNEDGKTNFGESAELDETEDEGKFGYSDGDGREDGTAEGKPERVATPEPTSLPEIKESEDYLDDSDEPIIFEEPLGSDKPSVDSDEDGPIVEPESQPEPESQSEPESQPEPESQSEPESQPEPESTGGENPQSNDGEKPTTSNKQRDGKVDSGSDSTNGGKTRPETEPTKDPGTKNAGGTDRSKGADSNSSSEDESSNMHGFGEVIDALSKATGKVRPDVNRSDIRRVFGEVLGPLGSDETTTDQTANRFSQGNGAD